uniref:Uncharacterized protein n=1 Tax=Tetranychus urticae TaxID=32264 RepID=T1JW79_TETUR
MPVATFSDSSADYTLYSDFNTHHFSANLSF